MIWFFTIYAIILLITGLEASTNGHKTLGGMLVILGAVAITVGVVMDIYLIMDLKG